MKAMNTIVPESFIPQGVADHQWQQLLPLYFLGYKEKGQIELNGPSGMLNDNNWKS